MAKAKVSVELDLAVVEEAIKAEVAPAVRDVLARHYDIPQMIADELLREPEKKDQDRAHDYLTRYIMFSGAPESGRPLVEGLVRSAIKDAAEEYVKLVIDERRDVICAAFRKMMASSPDRLVNAFVEMIEGADLSLELATTLSIEKSRD